MTARINQAYFTKNLLLMASVSGNARILAGVFEFPQGLFFDSEA
jgi:hypothetical protein